MHIFIQISSFLKNKFCRYYSTTPQFSFPPQKKRRKLRVADAWDKLVEEEQEKRLDQDDVARVALADAAANGDPLHVQHALQADDAQRHTAGKLF